jgi:NAD(P)H-hydrate epimerase
METAELAPLVPAQPPGAHKGTRGHVLIIAGSAGKTGAALLAARGAHRAGAGLVTLASTRAGQAALDAKVVETMTDADADSYERVVALAQGMKADMKAAAVGPGIPTGTQMAALVRRMVRELAIPLVIDADALNLLAEDAAAVVKHSPAARILTPHPGEMARLWGVSSADVQRDRLGYARRLAAASGAVVVLKGARTIIAAPDETAWINPAADAALGTAGSGDVLTGVITALCGLGLEAIDAARLGVHAHGLSAALAIEALGGRTLVAGDLPDAIARALEHMVRCR